MSAFLSPDEDATVRNVSDMGDASSVSGSVRLSERPPTRTETVSLTTLANLEYNEYLPTVTQGEVNMIDAESVDEWVERQIPLFQPTHVTSADEPCVPCKVLLTSLIEDVAKQDEWSIRMPHIAPALRARRWIWMNTDGMCERVFFTHLVRLAWLFHPYVFSHAYRQDFARGAHHVMQRLVREAEIDNFRERVLRGPPPGAFEPEATVPADDDVLEVISSDDEQ